MKIAFLGLGVMGYPMAGHLFKAGYNVTVFNRSSQRAVDWQKEYGADSNSRASSVIDACSGADMIFTCLGNDDDVREVMLGEGGVIEVAKEGALVCDHTTSSAKLARELHDTFKMKNISFLDAPVSGGQAGAQKGILSIMLGGQPEAFKKVLPKLQSYGKQIVLIGDAGSGQLAKMVNQICICGVLEGLAEALHFGEHAGVDMDKVLSVISGGAAQSWQMDNRASTMLQRRFDFGFAVDWMRKDLAFVLEEADSMKLELPLVKQVDEYYKEIQAMGGKRWDTSSLVARYTK